MNWLITGVAGLAALIGAFFFGRSTGIDHERARNLAALEKGRKAIEQSIAQVQAVDRARVEQEGQRQTIVREIYREVPKILDRPVYRNVCVDADGVRIIRRAVAAANGRGDAAGRTDGEPGDVR